MANTRQWPENKVGAAVNALSAAIAEAEKQEPVAWLYRDAWGTLKLSQIMPPPVGAFPVYTTPPRREWVGLTDEDIFQMGLSNYIQVIREAEAKLKEKNA